MMKIYNPQYAITDKDMSSQILHTCDYIDGGMEEAIQFTMAIITEHTSVYNFFTMESTYISEEQLSSSPSIYV